MLMEDSENQIEDSRLKIEEEEKILMLMEDSEE